MFNTPLEIFKTILKNTNSTNIRIVKDDAKHYRMDLHRSKYVPQIFKNSPDDVNDTWLYNVVQRTLAAFRYSLKNYLL